MGDKDPNLHEERASTDGWAIIPGEFRRRKEEAAATAKANAVVVPVVATDFSDIETDGEPVAEQTPCVGEPPCPELLIDDMNEYEGRTTIPTGHVATPEGLPEERHTSIVIMEPTASNEGDACMSEPTTLQLYREQLAREYQNLVERETEWREQIQLVVDAVLSQLVTQIREFLQTEKFRNSAKFNVSMAQLLEEMESFSVGCVELVDLKVEELNRIHIGVKTGWLEIDQIAGCPMPLNYDPTEMIFTVTLFGAVAEE